MLRNYLKIAWRTLRREKGYVAINLVGLAIGLAACLMIGLYLQHELSFDRFHEQSEDIYRVASDRGDRVVARAPLPAGPLLEESFLAIDHAVRFSMGQETLVEHGDRRFYEDRFAYTDAAFFDVFDFEVLSGDPATDLARPFTVFLSRSIAKKYFPDGSPVGKTLQIDGERDYEVVGLFEDAPANSHIRFDFLSSWESEYATGLDRDRWDVAAATYLLVPDQAKAQQLNQQLTDFFERTHPDQQAQSENAYTLTPLHDIRLYAQQEWEMTPQGDIRHVYLFSAIALFLLFIACVNYMNLATARAMRRAQEVGVRKSMGATRGDVARQFMAESFILVTTAVAVAAALVKLAFPAFTSLMEMPVSVPFSLWMIPALLGTVVLVSLLAGSYPAAYLSGFSPIQAFQRHSSSPQSGTLRRSLVVFQFALSAALVVATFGLHQQMQLIQDQRPGFDREQVVLMPTRGAAGKQYEALRREMLQHPTVAQVTLSSYEVGRGGSQLSFLSAEEIEGASFKGSEMVHVIHTDAHFLETFGIDLLRGQNMRQAGDAGVLANEAAVRVLGWDEPIGKRVHVGEQEEAVRGIVEDFVLTTLHDDIAPTLIVPGGDWYAATIAAKVAPTDLQAILAHLESQWNQFIPEQPFVYSFVDAEFDALYRTETRLAHLFTAAALLAVLIASLGVLGLVAFIVQTRRKEIGIRKVLGATAQSIVLLLSKDFLRLIGVALFLGIPLAYHGLDRWLNTFAYRAEIGVGLVVSTAICLLGAVLVSVSYHALRAAWTDPAVALRDE